MNKDIFCLNPVIIQAHTLAYNLSIYKRYHTPNGMIYIDESVAATYRYCFPKYKYSCRRLGVTIDNVEEFYIPTFDGEIIYMFMVVPCSKCTLCRDKKKREWSFRAICENVYSTSQPLFITCTYNPKHLPKHGVFKEEFQLFMKRVRINLSRKGIDSSNLRYFAVGEYGHKSGRPHYHAIFWSFPSAHFPNITAVLHFIESCWRVPTGDYLSDGTPVTDSLGFCLVKPCDKGVISYVMKYMRKEPSVPKGCRPVFFLSSRKNGGLGARYARDYKDFYMKHPDCLDISVTDPFSGATQTAFLPSYFKRLYYPSNSSVLDKPTRDAFKQFTLLISERIQNEYQLNKLLGDPVTPKISNLEKQIYKKFWFLKVQTYCRPEILNPDSRYYNRIYKRNLAIELELDYYIRFLSLVTYDESYISVRSELLKKREFSLNRLFASKEQLNLNDVNYNLVQAIKLAYEKEIL
nr:MAG TPA: Replication associated protein [Microviridae sp.]